MTAHDAAVEAYARRVIEEVPGCAVGSVSCNHSGLSIRFVGWSASLHLGGHRVQEPRPTPSGGVTGAAAALAPVIAAQRARLAAARALGHERARPYNDLSHLMVERLVLAHETDLPSLVAALVSSQLQAKYGATADAMASGRVRISAPCGGDPHPYVHASASRPWGMFDGSTVTLQRQLPESAVAMLPGRTVGDIIAADALGEALAPLADRVILDAAVVGRCTSITVTPDWMPLT